MEAGRFKALTGGDQITTQTKYGPFFDFTNKAKLLFSANALPVSGDDSLAYYRRWVIIPFPFTFAGAAARNQDELIAELASEFPGLLNAALRARKDLKARRRFDCDTETMEEKRDRYKKATNSVYAFIEDHIVLDPDAADGEEKNRVYAAYRAYCEEIKSLAYTEEHFWRKFKQELVSRRFTFDTWQAHGKVRKVRFIRLVDKKNEDDEPGEPSEPGETKLTDLRDWE